MSLGCIVEGGTEPPDTIIDTSTLNISLDNQGIANLSIIVLTKSEDPLFNSRVSIELNSVTFQGYIFSDNPSRLEGSEYFEHNITARGMIC